MERSAAWAAAVSSTVGFLSLLVYSIEEIKGISKINASAARMGYPQGKRRSRASREDSREAIRYHRFFKIYLPLKLIQQYDISFDRGSQEKKSLVKCKIFKTILSELSADPILLSATVRKGCFTRSKNIKGSIIPLTKSGFQDIICSSLEQIFKCK